MKKRLVIFVILLTLFPVVGLAETYWGGELPSIADTNVKAEITLNGDIYTYIYTVGSGKTNSGDIWRFRIDVKKPETGSDLSGDGIVNDTGYLKNTAAIILSDPKTPKMIPVGLFSPSDWVSGPDIFGTVGWGATDHEFMIFPGNSLSGFQITTRGLPGLIDFRIEPYLIPPSEGEILPEQIKEVKGKAAFKGKTLGPTAPSVNFVALDFLSYLIDLKHQAAELGWITNPGVEDSLDVKLDQVKVKLQTGDTKTAANQLSAFLNEVSAQGCQSHDNCPKGKHLAPEAWGLLYFNGKYLLDQIAL
jgi:hypothetical protein